MTADWFASQSRNSAFLGAKLLGKASEVLVGGYFALRNGKVVASDASAARRAARARGRDASSAGWSCGADGEAVGEAVFNTSMTGYQEVLTDPSYAGPDRHDDDAAHRQLRRQRRGHGVARHVRRRLRRARDEPHRVELARASSRCPSSCAAQGVVAIEGVDTRRLTRHLRERGAMRAVISTSDLDPASLAAKAAASPGLVGRDLVREVAVTEPYRWGIEDPTGCLPVDTGVLPLEPRYRVVAFDSGVKYNILRRLSEAGCDVTVVPPDDARGRGARAVARRRLPRERPGRPVGGRLPVRHAARAARQGAGLRHLPRPPDALARARGATTYKLKYGHRGGNQPVMNLLTGRGRDHEPEPRVLRGLRLDRAARRGAQRRSRARPGRPRRVGRAHGWRPS